MIVVTGAAGFIGSCMISKLNQDGQNDIIAVDKFNRADKNKNLEHKEISAKVERDQFFDWLDANQTSVTFIIHIGARTDTSEFDKEIFDELNVNYTKDIWKACVQYNIPMVYASSAATYGMGELGYKDDHSIIPMLKPLNPYGESKNEFDIWALQQEMTPPFWAGFKFFNVYGPNEFHKGRMASVIFHAFNQIGTTNKMNLFKSHNPDFKDGEQLRDFVYVKDVVSVIAFFMKNQPENGIFNLGTGSARSFLDLVKTTFKAMQLEENIGFIRDKYQYFTEADMLKLKNCGYGMPFTSLEDGVEDYVRNYLMPEKYF
ncbi:MAG: ADP-glyceromanno-heptose 6-epimerase [Bacteroidales bacterium]|nr:ADP-glyceromanno-heptose 6-epimerase [Bacteroidales bacterium]